MNAVSRLLSGPQTPLVPEDAPFSPAQRAWLNGFLAGLFGDEGHGAGVSTAEPSAEHFPWHDPTLELDERLKLAKGHPFERRLMAAMAQLDCGQCGYLCQTYGEALAAGRERSASLCVPGAKTTSKTLKQMLSEHPVSLAPVEAVRAVAGSPVRVIEAARLAGDGSAKDVRHVRIDLAASGLVYHPGDSIGIAPHNDPALVEMCLKALGVDGLAAAGCSDGVTRTLRDVFSSQVDIARPLEATMALLARAATDPREAALLRQLAEGEDGGEPADADLLDLLQSYSSARPNVLDLVQTLPSLKPRLYSIASSMRAVPGEVHLCVNVVQQERRGRIRQGVASWFLAHRAVDYEAVLAHVQRSHFRLPADPVIPLIMIGPGTGIAPFRAFLQERAASQQAGRTWLFFGAQHACHDFLFQAELRGWLADGTLTRLDTAWSRDQATKVYVQDRMREHASEVWQWLAMGARIYVCGDATRMAGDVDAALRQIAASQGGLDEAQAKEWLASLAQRGRYLRDVY